MNVFAPLYQQLDEWNFDGDEVMLWWRDDDAVAETASLEPLLALSERFDLPLALAVIPDGLQDTLVSRVKSQPLVQVLQHGVRHQSHAPQQEKNQELSRYADIGQLSTELKQGFETLSDAFGSQFIPVMVPPWNRIDEEVIEVLVGLGYLGLSCFQPRQTPEVADNVWLVNTHIDIIAWKNNKAFVGAEEAIRQMVGHLEAKRNGTADRAEPTGLMTHHLVHNQACWDFLAEFFAILDEHPAVTWLSAERVFQTKWRLD